MLYVDLRYISQLFIKNETNKKKEEEITRIIHLIL